MDFVKDQRIDEYISTLPSWQQDICQQIRTLVHTTDPEKVETIKRTKQPYFTLHGNVCALLGAKDHVNIFIYDTIAPDPKKNNKSRTRQSYCKSNTNSSRRKIYKQAFLNLITAVIPNNRAGSWRKLQKSPHA